MKIRFRYLAWLGSLLFNSTLSGQGATPVSYDTHVSRVADRMRKLQVPGIVIAKHASTDSEPVFHYFGVADVVSNEPLQKAHHVRAGSVLKMAVGTAVLQLVSEGKIRLDEPIQTYLPNVPEGERITVRMLGNHTSGIFNALADADFRERINQAPEQTLSHEDILQVTFSHKLLNKPGEKFNYSNSNTILLAEIIERVTGRPWADEVRRRVFLPLGASKSFAGLSDKLPSPAPKGYRFGGKQGSIAYGKVFFDATNFNPSWAGAGGDWVTTAHDLMAMAKPLASGALLTEAMRLEQRKWVDTGHKTLRYGFCLAEWNGHLLGHSGDVPGFSSFVAWDSKSDAALIVWCNLSNTLSKENPAEMAGMELMEKLSAGEASAATSADRR